MNFLAGRLAGTEGAYFLQESRHAIGRLTQKKREVPNSSSSLSKASPMEDEAQADVLPEILGHSLPSKILKPPSDSSLSSASKWVLHSDPNRVYSVSADVLNPLRAYLSLPQVTFGPKRWRLPDTEHTVLASTANELRRDRNSTHVHPEKLKAAAEGLSQIGKPFAAATTMIFGGATLVFGLTASKLDLHNRDDIQKKGRDWVQPISKMAKQQLIPLKIWAENTSKKWHVERERDIKEKSIVKELSKILGAKTSN